MKTPLLNPLTKRCVDRSTRKTFAFSFLCDQCGREWRSANRAFDPGELKPPAAVLRMLWDDQHKAAYEQANLEAICSFCLCPECGRRVCLECFRRYETDTADICADCLQKGGCSAHDASSIEHNSLR